MHERAIKHWNELKFKLILIVELKCGYKQVVKANNNKNILSDESIIAGQTWKDLKLFAMKNVLSDKTRIAFDTWEYIKDAAILTDQTIIADTTWKGLKMKQAMAEDYQTQEWFELLIGAELSLF